MKKILLFIALGVLISCQDQGEEKEVELEDYNNSEPLENPEIPAVNISEDAVSGDSLAVDSLSQDSAAVKDTTTE